MRYKGKDLFINNFQVQKLTKNIKHHFIVIHLKNKRKY